MRARTVEPPARVASVHWRAVYTPLWRTAFTPGPDAVFVAPTVLMISQLISGRCTSRSRSDSRTCVRSAFSCWRTWLTVIVNPVRLRGRRIRPNF